MDLFEYAKQARDVARDRVDRHADDDWRETMDAVVVAVAKDLAYFTTDDVFERFSELDHRPETHDRRAMGPVMLRAAKKMVCKKHNGPWQMSSRRSRHAAPLQVWESLIFVAKQ